MLRLRRARRLGFRNPQSAFKGFSETDERFAVSKTPRAPDGVRQFAKLSIRQFAQGGVQQLESQEIVPSLLRLMNQPRRRRCQHERRGLFAAAARTSSANASVANLRHAGIVLFSGCAFRHAALAL